MDRTYAELVRLTTYKERFEYLALRGHVGESTFGFDRYINQGFYKSRQWRDLRHHVIARDVGRDLAFEGYEIHSNLIVHHMNPMTEEAVMDGDPRILNPEFLITTTLDTHNAIHYGNESLLPKLVVERKPGDTKMW